MPAVSSAQAHTAGAALAVKRGRRSLRSMAPGLRRAVRSMLSMSETQLRHFATTKGRAKLSRKR